MRLGGNGRHHSHWMRLALCVCGSQLVTHRGSGEGLVSSLRRRDALCPSVGECGGVDLEGRGPGGPISLGNGVIALPGRVRRFTLHAFCVECCQHSMV